MASMLTKNALLLTRKSFQALTPRLSTNIRLYSEKTTPYYDPAEGKEGNTNTNSNSDTIDIVI